MTTSNNIVFFGTPEFAAGILQHLLDEGFPVRGVVTAPDRPAGRGRRLQAPPVKVLAVREGLPFLQPEKLKDPRFLAALEEWKPTLQVVVAFRMLPREVWSLPPLGTINLHASLLPQYRGAAPIQHALLHGEKVTGVTTFFIDDQIDTGKIILRKEVPITPNDNAGTLTEKLLHEGAALTAATIRQIFAGEAKAVEQTLPEGEILRPAPKIRSEDLMIDWSASAGEIHNRIRAFSPHPGARTYVLDRNGKKLMLKIYAAIPRQEEHSLPVPSFVSDGKTFLDIAIRNGFLRLQEVQIEGRKKMKAEEFLRGTDPQGLTFAV